MDLIFKTKKAIEVDNLIEAGDHVLVAVSGGIDSMVLAHILMEIVDEIGFIISVAHVNHGLRGQESDEDMEFVKEFCRQKEVPFYATQWQGPGKGENIQDGARNFRYKTFSEIAKKIGAGKIALAHNLEDQAETVLINIIRGAGLDGICGMDFKREFNDGLFIIRPFLEISRSEIEMFSRENVVTFREDVTNDQTKYTRNFIRHEIMPAIRRINPRAPQSIADMSHLLKMDERYLHQMAAEIFDQIIEIGDGEKIIFDGLRFKKLEQSIRTRILKFAYIKISGNIAGIGKDHILKMDKIAMSTKRDGQYNLPHTLHFKKQGTKLAIFKD